MGAVIGAVIGSVGSRVVERLRGRQELALRRREDVKDALLACHRASRDVLTSVQAVWIFNISKPSDGAMSPYRAAMNTSFWDVEVLLPAASKVRDRLEAYNHALNVFLGGWAKGHRSDELYEKVSSTQKALQDEIREELQRL